MFYLVAYKYVRPIGSVVRVRVFSDEVDAEEFAIKNQGILVKSGSFEIIS